MASAQREHLGCAQGELDDAKRLQRCHPQGKKKSNRRLTILLPLSSTDVNVRLCKLCRRCPALTTACNLSCTSSSKKAASGAFGIGSTVLGEGSRGSLEPGEGFLCTHCMTAAAAELFPWDTWTKVPFLRAVSLASTVLLPAAFGNSKRRGNTTVCSYSLSTSLYRAPAFLSLCSMISSPCICELPFPLHFAFSSIT